jgi:hypothetical protein
MFNDSVNNSVMTSCFRSKLWSTAIYAKNWTCSVKVRLHMYSDIWVEVSKVYWDAEW